MTDELIIERSMMKANIEILKELENVKEMKTTELEWYYNKV